MDAPYEHNSGEPYEASEHDMAQGESWDIYRLHFEGPFKTPADIFPPNSPYSVRDINNGAIAWLSTEKWCKTKVYIPAGTTIRDFVSLVMSAGGTVYMPVTDISQLT